MADEAYPVPAEGTVEYQRFVVDPGWTEDKWIKAIECQPGNPADRASHHRVHHSAGRRRPVVAGRAANQLAGRIRPRPATRGIAEKGGPLRQKGSKLLFEMHYTPNGVAAT